eukprot:7119572-Karenia_brevis.AAC.1
MVVDDEIIPVLITIVIMRGIIFINIIIMIIIVVILAIISSSISSISTISSIDIDSCMSMIIFIVTT